MIQKTILVLLWLAATTCGSAQDTLYAVSDEYMISGSFDRYSDLDRIIVEDGNCRVETISSFKVFELFGSLKKTSPLDLIIDPKGRVFLFFIDGAIYELDLISNAINYLDSMPNSTGLSGALYLNDTTWVLSSGEVFLYDVPTQIFTEVWGGIPGFNNGVTSDASIYKGEVYFVYINPQYHDFYRLNLDDTPVTVDSLFAYAPVGSLDYIYGLASYPRSCDSTTMYGVSFERFISTHPNFVTLVDIEAGTSTRLCPVDKGYSGLASLREQEIIPCHLLLDLDGDDSSGATGQDYIHAAVCPQAAVSLSDVDGLIESERPLDSLWVHFESGQLDGAAEQLVFSASGPWTWAIAPSGDLVIRFTGSSLVGDWSAALQQIQYVHSSPLPSPGRRTFEVIAWSEARSDTAYAWLDVVAGVSAGQDSTVAICSNGGVVDLSSYLRGATDLDGDWLPGGSSQYDPVGGSGMLQYVVHSAVGCASDTAQISITVHPAPLLDLGPDQWVCPGDTVYLQVSGDPYQYAWSNGSTDSVLAATQAGQYVLTVTDVQGCRGEDSTEIAHYEEEHNIVQQQMCYGDSTYFGDEWLHQSGIYTDTLQAVHGCDSIVELDLEELPYFEPAIYGDSLLCAEEVGAAFSTDAYEEIIWSTGDTSISTTVPGAGVVSLWVRDEQGCVGEAVWEIRQSSPISIKVKTTSASCPAVSDGVIRMEEVIGGYPAYTLLLEGELIEHGETISGLYSGDYVLEVTDEEGCMLDSLIHVSAGAIRKIDLGPDQEFSPGDDLQITHIGDSLVGPISWQLMGAPAEYETTGSYLRLLGLSGDVEVIGHSELSDPCVVGDSLLVTYASEYEIFVPNVFTPNGDGLNDILSVYTIDGDAEVMSMEVYDRWGGLIWRGEDIRVNNAGDGWDAAIDTGVLNPGVYVWLLRIRFSDGEERSFSGDVLLVR